VQVTILRDRKQQTLTLQVDSKHKTGGLLQQQFFSNGDCPLVAELDPDLAQMFDPDGQAARSLRDQARALADQMKANSFQFDRKQLDELKQQMEEFRKNFKPEDFKVDPKEMQEMKQQLEELKGLPAGDFN